MIDEQALHDRFMTAAQTIEPAADLLAGARVRRHRQLRVGRVRRVSLTTAAAVARAAAVVVPSWLADRGPAKPPVTSVAVADDPSPAARAEMGVTGTAGEGQRVTSGGYTFDLPPGFAVNHGPTDQDEWETKGIVTRAKALTGLPGHGPATLMMITYHGPIAIDAIAGWKQDDLNRLVTIDGHRGLVSVDDSAPAAGTRVITSGDGPADPGTCQPASVLPGPPRVSIDLALDAETIVSIWTNGIPEDTVTGILRSALPP